MVASVRFSNLPPRTPRPRQILSEPCDERQCIARNVRSPSQPSDWSSARGAPAGE
jgi:hypothetical protein